MNKSLITPGGPSSTYADYVVDTLRADIVSGAVEPHARLAMKGLIERYRVGMTPIREALQRLVGEGFVRLVGNQGFSVPPLSLEDLRDLTELRQLVEIACVRGAIQRGDDAWEAGIVAAFHRLERQAARFADTDEDAVRQYDTVHRAFHVSMYAGVTSPRLCALHANLFDQAFRYRKLLHQEPIDPAEVIDEHRSLMRVLLERDLPAAESALMRHLGLTRDVGEKRLATGVVDDGSSAGKGRPHNEAADGAPASVTRGRGKGRKGAAQ